MNSKEKVLVTISIILPATGLAIYYSWLPDHIEELKEFARNHKLLTPIFIIFWRFLAVVIPPIPGGIVSLALLPIVGWWQSYLYAKLGVLAGITVAFHLARHYREKLVSRFVPLKQMRHWESRLSESQEFWAFLTLRTVTSPVLDFLSYVAGLSKIKFWKFFLICFIGMIPEAALYYFGEEVYKRSSVAAIILLVMVAVIAYLYKTLGTKKS